VVGLDNQVIYAVRDVSYGYPGGFPALERVSLQICAGERVAILGANGSGKSSLLRLLDGLAFPSSGTVSAFDEVLSEAAFQSDAFNFAFRRRVGLVFQDSDVQLFSPSVWEEVAFAPLQLGMSGEQVGARVESALEALHLIGLRDRAPHRLSGGEKKRVALASILSLAPQVWLMDEPTAGLDPRSQAWLEDFILDQSDSGKTVILATHDLEFAAAVAGRVYVFSEDHHLAGEGAPEQVLADHALLAACNLVHEHAHRHPGETLPHRHPHQHGLSHTHTHDAAEGDRQAPSH
jgi:cobalt/nickel transport system ATP-binding protein